MRAIYPPHHTTPQHTPTRTQVRKWRRLPRLTPQLTPRPSAYVLLVDDSDTRQLPLPWPCVDGGACGGGGQCAAPPAGRAIQQQGLRHQDPRVRSCATKCAPHLLLGRPSWARAHNGGGSGGGGSVCAAGGAGAQCPRAGEVCAGLADWLCSGELRGAVRRRLISASWCGHCRYAMFSCQVRCGARHAQLDIADARFQRGRSWIRIGPFPPGEQWSPPTPSQCPWRSSKAWRVECWCRVSYAGEAATFAQLRSTAPTALRALMRSWVSLHRSRPR